MNTHGFCRTIILCATSLKIGTLSNLSQFFLEGLKLIDFEICGPIL